jgi:uncharacterized SAM-binding protein YcdF (DUF218 family)
MSPYVENLLRILVYPLGLGLVLCIAAFVLSFADRIRALRASLAAAVILLWLASTPVFAALLSVVVEEKNPSTALEEISPKDVIIVLGGGLARPAKMGSAGDRVIQTARLLCAGSDRVMQAALLWRGGKGGTIIISGGDLPWVRSNEASLAAEILEAYGVPSDSIIVEGNSRNTHENAVNTAAIWKERRYHSGILVTSAIHMPRALASFRKVGLDVTPWSADVSDQYPLVNSVFDLLPDARALAATTAAIKEWVGLAVYRLRGWA